MKLAMVPGEICNLSFVDFDSAQDLMRGSWTIYDCMLIDRFSEGVGRALSTLVQDERERTRRLKRVGLWSIRSLAKSARSIYEHLKGLKGLGYFSELGDRFGEPFATM